MAARDVRIGVLRGRENSFPDAFIAKVNSLGKGVVVGAGAKILGPFVVGDGAKVGSNSVVVKAVPEGATAVGIPARIVEDHTAARMAIHPPVVTARLARPGPADAVLRVACDRGRGRDARGPHAHRPGPWPGGTPPCGQPRARRS